MVERAKDLDVARLVVDLDRSKQDVLGFLEIVCIRGK